MWKILSTLCSWRWPLAAGGVLRDLSKGLQVAPNDGVDKNTRVFFGVSWGYVNDIGFQDHGAGAGGGGVESGDRSVIGEAVVTTDHAEAEDVALVVEDFEALGAVGRGEAGDDVDLAESADISIANNDVATLDEVLVGLWIVEAADDGPDGGDRGGDLLDDGGAALIGADDVGVVAWHSVGDLGGAR